MADDGVAGKYRTVGVNALEVLMIGAEKKDLSDAMHVGLTKLVVCFHHCLTSVVR